MTRAKLELSRIQEEERQAEGVQSGYIGGNIRRRLAWKQLRINRRYARGF